MTKIQIELPDATAQAAQTAGLLWLGTPHALLNQTRAGMMELVASPDFIAGAGTKSAMLSR